MKVQSAVRGSLGGSHEVHENLPFPPRDSAPKRDILFGLYGTPLFAPRKRNQIIDTFVTIIYNAVLWGMAPIQFIEISGTHTKINLRYSFEPQIAIEWDIKGGE